MADSFSGKYKRIVDSSQAAVSGTEPLAGTLDPAALSDVSLSPSSACSGTNNCYISAASTSKLDSSSSMKTIFSEDEFNCCIPAGGTIPSGAQATSCCTGTLTNQNGALRCCLGDFTDVSVYLNRYVSSEGRGLSESSYDPETGYIKDSGQVQAIAEAKGLCCSGKMALGSAIGSLFIPLTGGTVSQGSDGKTVRFIEGDDAVNNNTQTGSRGSLFDAGLKWNNHYYCVPSTFQAP